MIFNYLQLFSFNLLIETRYKLFQPIQFMQTLFNRYKEYKMERQLCHKSIPDTQLEVDKENEIDILKVHLPSLPRYSDLLNFKTFYKYWI